MRIAATVLVCAAAVHADVDTKFVGVWTTKVGDRTLTWEIHESGAFVMRAEQSHPSGGQYGALEAAGGRFKLRTAASRRDRGTYTFDGEDRVTVVSPDEGKRVWQRGSKVPQFTPPPMLPEHRKALGVRESFDVARAHAALWRKDAFLVAVTGTASADGTFDVTKGDALLLFTFRSPATYEALEILATKAGDMAWRTRPPDPDLGVPVADGFLDLVDVVKAAVASGYKAKPRVRVLLRSWEGKKGIGSAWQLGDPLLVLDALTARPTTSYEIMGRLGPDDWAKGKALKLGHDAAEWRKEADLWAKEWQDGARPFEVWVTGSYRADRLEPRRIVFRYFAVVREEILCASVEVRADGLTGHAEIMPTRTLKPEPLPDDLVSAGEAASVLWKLNPQVPQDHTYLQLVHVKDHGVSCTEPQMGLGQEAATWPLAFEQDRDALGGSVLNCLPFPEGKGGWMWRMIARRPLPLAGPAQRDDSVLNVVYCNAKTGEPLSAAAPTFLPRDRR